MLCVREEDTYFHILEKNHIVKIDDGIFRVRLIKFASV